MSLQILSIGIIGRHLQPLYIQYYTKSSRQDPLLKWHYACHMALDIFDERGALTLLYYLQRLVHSKVTHRCSECKTFGRLSRFYSIQWTITQCKSFYILD